MRTCECIVFWRIGWDDNNLLFSRGYLPHDDLLLKHGLNVETDSYTYVYSIYSIHTYFNTYAAFIMGV